MIAAHDNISGYIMATFTDSLGNAFDCQLWRRQPDVKQLAKAAQLSGFGAQGMVTACGQRGLYGKGDSFMQQLFYSAEHDTSGLHAHTFRMERRKAFGNLIGIYKLLTVKDVRQKGE